MITYLFGLISGLFSSESPDVISTPTTTPARVEPTTPAPKTRTKLIAIPINHEPHYFFARMGNAATEPVDLPPPVKNVRGELVSLEEVPFEKTRSELIQIYLSIIIRHVGEKQLHTISSQNLVSHFLFLKTLVATESDAVRKSQLLPLANSIAQHLMKNEADLWQRVVQYRDNSEYPIVQWLKHRNVEYNFISSFIYDFHRMSLTHNQNAFMQKFKESAAFFFPNPVYTAWLNQTFETDSKLNPMYRDASSTHYYHAAITDNLLLRTEPRQVSFAPEHYFQEGKGSIDTSYRFNINSARFLSIQGRTLLFMTDTNDIIAMKVQKSDEPQSALTEEYQMADYLLKHKSRLQLQSELPTPLGQYSVKRNVILDKCNKSPDFQKLKGMISDKTDLEVYVYKASPDYFTYLHDKQQSLSQFTSSVKKNVHDLFILLREGIVFSQLADIFHTHLDQKNRDDKGRYQALVQLLNVLQFQMGRVDNWKEAVEYVNLRSSGLADVGDSVPISSLLTVSDFTKKYHSELLSGGYHQTYIDKTTGTARSLFTNKRQLFGNYLYLNVIAEYLLVIQLTLGSYGDKVTEGMDSEHKAAVWQKLADVMFNSCADAVTLMTGIPQSRALSLLKQRANCCTHSKQMNFWMTTDYAALSESAIKSQQYALYPGENGYEVKDKLVRGVGLAIDGVHQDLGGYNQASPLRELEKLLYATVTLIEGTQQLDKQFLEQLDKTESLIKQSSKASECYEAVALLLDSARPGCQFQKKLALSYHETIKSMYPLAPNPHTSRFDNIAQHDAAITIQRFWRAHHKKEEHSNVDSMKVGYARS